MTQEQPELQQSVAQHYNSNQTFDYESVRLTEHAPIEFAVTAHYLKKMIPDKATVADVGVGTGHYAELLAERDCTLYLADISQRLLDASYPQKMALLVYDLQVGIMSQLPPEKGDRIKKQVLRVLQTARAGGFRVFFCRHLSLPKEAAGVFQLRQVIVWQRTDQVSEVNPWFLRDSDAFQLIPELAPRPSAVNL